MAVSPFLTSIFSIQVKRESYVAQGTNVEATGVPSHNTAITPEAVVPYDEENAENPSRVRIVRVQYIRYLI